MLLYAFLLVLIILFTFNCSNKKNEAKSYSEIELPIPEYTFIADTLPFRFAISDQAFLKVRKTRETEYFCDIVYPELDAQLYCTWHHIKPDELDILVEESRRLAYQHTIMATAINEEEYSNDFARIYARLYNIKGEVATPLQIAVTDSISYFFNASLYFNSTSDTDSIAPVITYLKKDIMHLVETFTVTHP